MENWHSLSTYVSYVFYIYYFQFSPLNSLNICIIFYRFRRLRLRKNAYLGSYTAASGRAGLITVIFDCKVFTICFFGKGDIIFYRSLVVKRGEKVWMGWQVEKKKVSFHLKKEVWASLKTRENVLRASIKGKIVVITIIMCYWAFTMS